MPVVGTYQKNLKKASIKLFCMYNTSIPVNQGKSSHVLHSEAMIDAPGTVLNDDDQVFIIRRGKGKGGRNRPNLEQTAIRRTQDAMNLKNRILAMGEAQHSTQDKGIRCYRCGKTDRTLRNCPLPYTPVLAYAPTRNKESTVQKNFVNR